MGSLIQPGCGGLENVFEQTLLVWAIVFLVLLLAFEVGSFHSGWVNYEFIILPS